jgi:hypothetical protein
MPPKQYLDFALDDPMLTGGLSLFLCTERAEWLRGKMMSVNWDFEEMEERKEILEMKFTKLAFTTAKFGKGGQPWSTRPDHTHDRDDNLHKKARSDTVT